MWAIKSVLQILSYVAGVFWLVDVLKTFMKKSAGQDQNSIQINMGGNDDSGRNVPKKVGDWQAGLKCQKRRRLLNSRDDPPPPYNL